MNASTMSSYPHATRDGVKFRQATLDNGLTIVAEVDEKAHSAAIGFFVKTGARDEDASIMGTSHFLEHMMFKGTESRTAEDVDRDFDNIGAEHNAYTSSELTCFHAHCLPEHLNIAEEVLSDIMRPAIRQQDFDDEKSVILEEIAMYADQPFWVLYERAVEAFFDTHPLSHRVLGTTESITSLQREQMIEYFTRRYSADNTTVALSGRLDFDDMVHRLRQHCGHWRRAHAARDITLPTYHALEFSQTDARISNSYLLMLSPAPSMQDPRRYAAAMLAHILGDAKGSRLYWALVEPGLAEEAAAQFDGHDHSGGWFVFASCAPERAVEVERTVKREIERLVDTLTEDDLERVRSKVLTAATLHSELPAGRMMRLGRQWTYQRAYTSLEEELRRMGTVTLNDLRAVFKAFPMSPRVVGRLVPGE